MSSSPLTLVSVLDQYAGMEWGFTGTRAGLAEFQEHMIGRTLKRGQPTIFRQGGAIGSDTQTFLIWRLKCKDKAQTCNVWPADEKRAAFFRRYERTTVEDVMPPLERNIVIVQKSAFMLATPQNEYEEQRSGTWQTIRQSLKHDIPILILWPRSQKLTLWRDRVLHRVSYTVTDK